MHQRIITKTEWDNKCKLPNVLSDCLDQTKFSPKYTEAAVFDFPQVHENINCSSLFWDSTF